jgi:hypothetical protein
MKENSKITDKPFGNPKMLGYTRRLLCANHIKLNVSSPAVLLNHVAQRYSDTQRIVMEYVDNSLDDAGDLFFHPIRQSKAACIRPSLLLLLVCNCS